jgi:hypothetical protein
MRATPARAHGGLDRRIGGTAMEVVMMHPSKHPRHDGRLRAATAAVAVALTLFAAGCSSGSKSASPATTEPAHHTTSHKKSHDSSPLETDDTDQLSTDQGSDTGGLETGGGTATNFGPTNFTPPSGYTLDTSVSAGNSYADQSGNEITDPSCEDDASSTASEAAMTCAQSLGQLSNVNGPKTGTASGRAEAGITGTAQPSGAAAIPLNFAVVCYQATRGFECATLLTTPDVDITSVISPFITAVEASFT